MIAKKVLPNACRDPRRCWIDATTFCAVVALVLLTCAIEATQAQNGNLFWAKRAGGLFDEQGNSIAVDSQGNSYVTGYFQDTGTFAPGETNQTQLISAGSADVFIAKYNSTGALIWAKRAGGINFDRGIAIAVDSQGNSYVVGAFTDTATFGSGEANQTQLSVAGTGADIFVAKYNSDGTLAWAKQAGGISGDSGFGIAVDNLGNSYVTGQFFGMATFGPGEANQTQHTSAGSFDFFIAKYNSNGTLAWAKRAGGLGFERGNGIALDSQGNSYAIGSFDTTAIFGLGEANQTTLTAALGDDIFIAKYNNNGALVWAKSAGGIGSDSGFGIAVDGQGDSYVTGLFNGTATFGLGETNQTQLTAASGSDDIFVAKYNGDGTLAWAKRAGGASTDIGYGIALDGESNSYVTGQFTGSATFGPGEANQTVLASTGVNADMFIAKYNGDGTLAWGKRAGGPNADHGRGVAVDSQGNSFVTGIFNLTATFGPGEANLANLTSNGFGDIFVAKFASGPILVNCPGDSLQTAANLTPSGFTILVTGSCSENVLIRNEKQRITIDGGGAATINAPSAASPALNVRGKGILIQGFTITGGSNGVHVNRGSNAVINNNVIQNTGGNGVVVDELAFAVLTNNTIQNNPGAGIFVSEASTARIGFNADSDSAVSANTIINNAVGVLVSNNSSVRIVGNVVQNNAGVGIQVLRDSHVDIASNAINGNADGIEVGENSFVQLGEDSGASIYESANTTTSTNTGVGIRCTNGGIADGRQGTLSGSGGAASFDSSCINSLLP